MFKLLLLKDQSFDVEIDLVTNFANHFLWEMHAVYIRSTCSKLFASTFKFRIAAHLISLGCQTSNPRIKGQVTADLELSKQVLFFCLSQPYCYQDLAIGEISKT